MKRFSLSLALACILVGGYGQIITWTGQGDGELWSDKNNWNNNELPSSISRVLINGEHEVLITEDSYCASLELRSTAILKIDNNATLTIDQSSSSDFHIKIGDKAMLHNYSGFIDIDATGVTTAIDNAGIVQNDALITVDDGVTAINSTDKAIFINDGDVLIHKSDSAIVNHGGFTNRHKIVIDSIHAIGIENHDEFTNTTGATVEIKDMLQTSGSGVRTENGGTTTNSGTIAVQNLQYGIISWGELINNDSIYVKNVGINPIINNGGTISNQQNAKIIISGGLGTDTYMLTNEENSIIYNHGLIAIDSSASHNGSGLNNNGTFYNEIGGVVIAKEVFFGLSNYGTFTNYSTVDIQDTNSGLISFGVIDNHETLRLNNNNFSIRNYGELHNHNDSHIDIDSTTYPFNNDYNPSGVCSFTNDGRLDISKCHYGIISRTPFINNGDIELGEITLSAITITSDTLHNNLNGNITLDESHSMVGIKNWATVINKGEIEISSCDCIAIENLHYIPAEAKDPNEREQKSGSTTYRIINDGSISIHEAITGIVNQEDLLNNGSIVISYFDEMGVDVSSNAIFTNNGFMYISSMSGTHGINMNEGTMHNNGDIEIQLIGLGNNIRINNDIELSGYKNMGGGKTLKNYEPSYAIRLDANSVLYNNSELEIYVGSIPDVTGIKVSDSEFLQTGTGECIISGRDIEPIVIDLGSIADILGLFETSPVNGYSE